MKNDFISVKDLKEIINSLPQIANPGEIKLVNININPPIISNDGHEYIRCELSFIWHDQDGWYLNSDHKLISNSAV